MRYFNLIIFGIILFNNGINCQIDIWQLDEEYPLSCSESEYFDTTQMQCLPCPIYTSSNIKDRKCRKK